MKFLSDPLAIFLGCLLFLALFKKGIAFFMEMDDEEDANQDFQETMQRKLADAYAKGMRDGHEITKNDLYDPAHIDQIAKIWIKDQLAMNLINLEN